MPARRLVLLSPYRPPTSYPVSLDAIEAAAWLNAWAALWHPAVLRGSLPPVPAAAYDHHTPMDAAIYALPQSSALYLPEDWRERAATAGAVVFDAVNDRATTLNNLAEALAVDLRSDEFTRACMGLGFAHLMLDTLFEAMNHEKLLDEERFWQTVQTAVALDVAEPSAQLAEATRMLADARESLLSGGVRLVDIVPVAALGANPVFSTTHPIVITGNVAELEQQPRVMESLKAADAASVDLAIGAVLERDDTLLPVESQLWNLRQARERATALTGQPVTLYARGRAEYHAHLPGWLHSAGYRGAMLLNAEQAPLPVFSSSFVQWPGPDGRVINTFARTPLASDDPLTLFNFACHIHSATQHESRPCVAFTRRGGPVASFADWRVLDAFAPIFGEWIRLSQALEDSHDADYVSMPSPDEFARDTLDHRISVEHAADPVSSVARHHRDRRRLDAAFTLAALHRSLTVPNNEDSTRELELIAHENAFETSGAIPPAFNSVNHYWQSRLAERILASSPAGPPGHLILNPCGFTRRLGVELPDAGAIPVEGPVKASEFTGGVARAVVEVPGLGFAWIPRGTPGHSPRPRIITAEGTCVRNEFLEAEIDPGTGGIKAVRDSRLRVHRLGQLLHGPGGHMRADSVTVTHAAACMGEITSRGVLVDNRDKPIANFTQRVRAWIGRPAIELHITLEPVTPPDGYAWQNHFSSRFAWRDERAALSRGVQGTLMPTTAHRITAPDFVEIRYGRERTCLFTGGLPFVQSHGRRMLDVILIPEGETAREFELLIAFDRDFPMATASGWLSPAIVLPTDRGPPMMGTSGWLAGHDLPSLLLSSLRPAAPGDGMTRAVEARFLETAGLAATADFRFAKDPRRVNQIDGHGTAMPVTMIADAIPLTASASELVNFKIEWA